MKRCLLLLAICVSPLAAHAEIFKWVDDQGKVQYGDAPPKEAKTKKVSGGVTVVPAIVVPPPASPVVKPKAEAPPEDESPRAGSISRIPEPATTSEKSASESAAAARARSIARCEENRGVDCEAEVDQQLYGQAGTTYVPGWSRPPIRPAQRPVPLPAKPAPARVIKEVENPPSTKNKTSK